MDQSNGGWLVSDNGQQTGPFSEDELITRARSGAYSPEAHIWREGMTDWVKLTVRFPQAARGASAPEATPGTGGFSPLPTNQYGGGQFGGFGVPTTPVYASGKHLAGRRAGAWLVDCVIWLVGMCLAFCAIGMFSGTSAAVDTNDPFSAFTNQSPLERIMGLVVTFIISLPWVTKDGWIRGQSPGKMLFKLRTINTATGEPAGIMDSLKRNAYFLVPCSCFVFVANLFILYQLFTVESGERQGDKWAGTLVAEA